MSGSIYLRKNGYKAVRQWKKNKEREKREVIEGKVGKSGHVYIFKLYDGFYKIGCTYNIAKRIKVLKASCPTLQCVWSAHVRDMNIFEKELHKHFHEKKVEREIFRLEQQDIRCADDMANKYR